MRRNCSRPVVVRWFACSHVYPRANYKSIVSAHSRRHALLFASKQRPTRKLRAHASKRAQGDDTDTQTIRRVGNGAREGRSAAASGQGSRRAFAETYKPMMYSTNWLYQQNACTRRRRHRPLEQWASRKRSGCRYCLF